jgi:hypothetical protein
VKQVITLILSLSLFVPHMAKMLAYVDCSYIMLSNSDPDFCDCSRIVDNDAIPMGPDQPDKQKEISLKADWKYVAANPYRFTATIPSVKKTAGIDHSHHLPQQSLIAVFRPPRS